MFKGLSLSLAFCWIGDVFRRVVWLRTNGVNTHGAAAKVMNFDRLGKRYALALWEYKRRLTGVPKRSLSKKNMKIGSCPISPCCPCVVFPCFPFRLPREALRSILVHLFPPALVESFSNAIVGRIVQELLKCLLKCNLYSKLLKSFSNSDPPLS